MTKYTILGSTGFIGSHLVSHLKSCGVEVNTPPRDAETLRGEKLGHVIYTIGLTGNFRERPHDAVDAHVNVLQRLMNGAQFDSWLYLSSTRVYGGLPEDTAATETVPLSVRPGLSGLYDLSKLLGESICLACDNPAVRVARLSNVYGTGQHPSTFLGSVLDEAVRTGSVTIGESPASSKDYISIDDVVRILPAIAANGHERIYNVADGAPVTHGEIADTLRAIGYRVDFAPGGQIRGFPTIDTTRIDKEFGSAKGVLTDDIPALIEELKLLHEENNREQASN